MYGHQLIFVGMLLAIGLAQLPVGNGQATTTSCSSSFKLVAGKCLSVNSRWANWYEADRYCHSVNATLMSLDNLTQLQQINQWLNATTSIVQDYWTSGNTLGVSKGNYYWESTGQLARYLPWATGQPQQNAGDCLLFASTNLKVADFKLKIENCTKWADVICEQKPVQTSSRICLKVGSYENATVLV